MTLARLAHVLAGDPSPGVHQLVTGALTGTVVARLRADGRAVTLLDSSDATGKATFLDAAARDLHLPAWFGRNWDALVDALRDTPALAVGAWVVWHGAAALGDDTLATAVEIVHEAATARGAHVLVVTAEPLDGIAPL